MRRGREMNWVWVIGAPLVRTILAMFFRMRIEGIEHVPRRGAVILAPNHVSVVDGPAQSAITGTHRWRATRNLIAAEVFAGAVGWILRQARQIPIRRGTGDTGALDVAVTALRGGSCVGLFPEGRVGDDPDAGLQRIRSGLTRVAIPDRVPVIPVGIWGTQVSWPHGGFDRQAALRRPTAAFVYGEPIVPAPDETPAEFRARFTVELQRHVDRARRIAQDGPGDGGRTGTPTS
jgi:1-acyl-sn-glycerol-3-phosphate acyltransferase